MANNDFPRLLTLLRKERGLSQKQAATDLQVSQALLSHYEKGIRECGLDFLLRAAEYYGVSCDYLLGRTSHRGAAPTPASPPREGGVGVRGGSSTAETQRRLLVGSLNIVFGILKKINSEGLTRQVSSYFSCAVYKMFRLLYSARGKNPQEAFFLDQRLYSAQADAHMTLSEAKSRYLLEGGNLENAQGLQQEQLPAITPARLQSAAPQYAPALLELVRSIEQELSALKES